MTPCNLVYTYQCFGENCCLQPQGIQMVSLYALSHKSSQKKPMFVVTALRTSNYVIITMAQAGRHKSGVQQERMLTRYLYCRTGITVICRLWREVWKWIEKKEWRKKRSVKAYDATIRASLLLLEVTESCVRSMADTTGNMNRPRPYILGWETLWPGWNVYRTTRRKFSPGYLQLKGTLCPASHENENCVGIRSTSCSIQPKPMLFWNPWITSLLLRPNTPLYYKWVFQGFMSVLPEH
jgi:hypothetical protein